MPDVRAGKTGGADALAAARPVCGAKGSFAGLTANVPGVVDMITFSSNG